MYDNQIGRFFTQDRFADYYHSLSVYQYTANSPVNFIDENGDYITIDRRDDKGNVMLSLLYEGGKAFYYTKDEEGNVIKGDAWDGEDEFIIQAVADIDQISSTKHGKTMVDDLSSSKYQTSISEAGRLLDSRHKPTSESGGGSIFYYQKGGRHINAGVNKSSVVLGHELYHAWAFEFTNENRGNNFGQRKIRETNAVLFENYLKASFGEKVMRTHYMLDGSNDRVASSSVEEAKNYKLPLAKYFKMVPQVKYERTLQRDVDNTFQRRTFIPLDTVDTRKSKL